MQVSPDQVPPKSKNNVLWIVLGVLAVCGCGGVVIMAAILFPVFSQAKLAAQKTIALHNVKQSSMGLILYSADYNDRLPPDTHWMDLTVSYIADPDSFKSPLATPNDSSDYGFAFRKEFSLKKVSEFPDPAYRATIFDGTLLSRNASSGLESLPNPGRYGTGERATNMIGFLDGHAQAVKDTMLKAMGADGKPTVR